MSEKDLSSREFASDPLRVKQLVKDHTVFVTNRGVRELAILPYEFFRKLQSLAQVTALEALANEAAAKIDFEPEKSQDISRAEVL
jgi:hypothetical protein